MVTVITPFFNTGIVFKETAASLLSQTLQQWEWIIVDDSTTDLHSISILSESVKELRAFNKQIKVIRHDANKGLSAARNTGIKAAKNEFVMLLDADDILEPTCLEKSYWKLATHPELAFVGSWTIGFGSQHYLWTRGFNEKAHFLRENLTTATVMLRRSTAIQVGGFEETRRNGLEDWDFWLRCAASGHWGDTIREPLNKYRRRETHVDRWSELTRERLLTFVATLSKRYPRLSEKTFPNPQHAWHYPSIPIRTDIPITPAIPKTKRRLLMLVPHFEMGGADKWNLDVLKYIVKQKNWEVTLVATLQNPGTSWLSQFEKLSTDIHLLSNYVPLPDYPRYLRWLMHTRTPDIVCITNSQFGYSFASILRAYFPKTPIVDYVHMEEEHWRSGGYPMDSVRHQNSLTLTGTTSKHLKKWMIARGASADKVRCIHINIDATFWTRANETLCQDIRAKLGLPDKNAILLYACRLVEQKQPDIFAETVELVLAKISVKKHILPDAFEGITFVVAGKGNEKYEDIIKKLASKHSLNVKYVGTKTTDEIKEIMNITDILFLPSKIEGISMAFYEAMAMNIVPMGANVGGQSELVTPECGILITREDKKTGTDGLKATEAQQYADAILSLLANPTKLQQMKINSRSRIEDHFQIEQMGEAMTKLLNDAIEMEKNPFTASPPGIPESEANAYANELIEQYRLMHLNEHLWITRGASNDVPTGTTFVEQFRNSAISPKFSRTKRNILRFLMKNL